MEGRNFFLEGQITYFYTFKGTTFLQVFSLAGRGDAPPSPPLLATALNCLEKFFSWEQRVYNHSLILSLSNLSSTIVHIMTQCTRSMAQESGVPTGEVF